MKKQLRQALPFMVFVAAILILIGVRASMTGSFSAEGRYPDVEGGTYSIESPVEKDGVTYLVPPDELYSNGLGKDGIPVLNSPKYDSIATADGVLADDVSGLSVEVDGKYRFYSFQILNWHEAVNDTFGGKNLLVSYSPLCGSAVVYDRTVSGEAREFGDEGLVYNDCAVFYDTSTSTLWNQATGAAIVGGELGTTLERYPSTVMTWAEFKDLHSSAEVLSTDTGYTRDYRRHPFGGYDTSSGIYFPVNKTDARLAVKDVVYDVVVAGGESTSLHVGFSMKPLLASSEPNIDAGSVEGKASLVGLVDSDNNVHIFERTVGDQVLTFVRATNTITDKETGSTWNSSGIAIKGTLKGKKLTEVYPTARYFAFAYVSQFPDAQIVGADSLSTNAADTTTSGSNDVIINQ